MQFLSLHRAKKSTRYGRRKSAGTITIYNRKSHGPWKQSFPTAPMVITLYSSPTHENFMIGSLVDSNDQIDKDLTKNSIWILLNTSCKSVYRSTNQALIKLRGSNHDYWNTQRDSSRRSACCSHSGNGIEIH